MPDILSLIISALEEARGAKTPPGVFSDLRTGTDVALVDLDMDSLSRFEVIMQIEEEYDIELDEDDLLDQKTVYGFAAFVAARVAKE